ncbi:MAG TPA: hypothetical protein VH518_19530 [Tepidisphaeraceae bacterium]|jgi:hypothetical protein
MEQALPFVIAVVAIAFFAWMMFGRGKSSNPDAVIDPNDARQIGELIGMTGGSIKDAAVAQFALQRFEQQHGRKATVRDMATVAGIMKQSS